MPPISSSAGKAELGDKKPLRILMAPDFRADNPYQALLAKGIEDNGGEVEFLSNYKRGLPFCRGARTSGGSLDVLHLHWPSPYLRGKNRISFIFYCFKVLLDIFILKSKSVRLIWTIHNIVPHEPKYAKTEVLFRRTLARLSNGIIVHDGTIKESVVKNYGVGRQKIYAVPHGHYRDVYKASRSRSKVRESLGIDSDKTLFLHLGMLRPYKGIETLIEIWKKMGEEFHQQSFLLIAGSPLNPAYEEKLKGMCAGTETINLLSNYLPAEEVANYYEAADVAVFPFKKVTTSGSLILAMSFGTPIIAPDIPQFWELLGENYPLFFKTNDPATLKASLTESRASGRNKLKNQITQQCDKLDWDTIGKQTMEIYSK